MWLSKFSENSEIGLLMSYQLAGKRVGPKVLYYAYAPSTHSHTLPSEKQRRPRQLKSSSVFPNSEFLPTNSVLALVMQFLSRFSSFWRPPYENLHRRGPRPSGPPCQYANVFIHTVKKWWCCLLLARIFVYGWSNSFRYSIISFSVYP